MNRFRLFAIISALFCITACQDTPDSPRETPQDSSGGGETSTVPVTELEQIEKTLWLDAKQALNSGYAHYFYIQADGRSWLIHRDFADAETEDCYVYEEYLGQYVAGNDNRYEVRTLDGESRGVRLSIEDNALIVQQENSNSQERYFTANENFDQLPKLCDLNNAEVPSDATPVIDIEQRDFNQILFVDTEFGTDRFEWVTQGTQEYFYNYVGDSHARADDCNYFFGLTGFYYQLEGNRYLLVDNDGSVRDLRAFETATNYFLAFERSVETYLIGDSSKQALDARVCANKLEPPAGSVKLTSISEAVGLWDISYRFSNGDLDSVYMNVLADGNIDLYDYRNDDVDEGENCAFRTESIASLSPEDGGGFTWFFDEDESFFARILSDEVDLFSLDGDLVIADDFVTRTWRSTSRTLDELPLCNDDGSNVPSGAAPQRRLEDFVGVFDFSDFDEDGNRLDTFYSVIDSDGFISDYEFDENQMCFDKRADVLRFQEQEDFLFDLVAFSGSLGNQEVFTFEDNLFIKPVDSNTANVFPFADIALDDIGPLCETPAPVPPGYVEVNQLQDFAGVWDLDFNEGGFLLRIDLDGSLSYLAKFTNVPQFSQHCLYEFDGEFVSVEAGEEGIPVFNFDDDFGVRRRAFVDTNSLILQDSDFTDEFVRSDLSFDEAQANCPSVADIPVGSEAVISIGQIEGLWNISTEPLEGIVDEKFRSIRLDGRVEFIDYLGDDFDEGDPCYLSFDDEFIEFVNPGENLVRFYYSSDQFDVFQAYFVDGNLLLADEDVTLTFTATDTVREDLSPSCTAALSRVQVADASNLDNRESTAAKYPTQQEKRQLRYQNDKRRVRPRQSIKNKAPEVRQ